MDILKRYEIAYKGLSNGNHHFDFEVSDKFYQAFENSEIIKGKAHVGVDVYKSGNTLSLHVDINGNVTVECDRCLEELTLPVNYEGDLQVRFSETENYSDGEIMWISPNETEINLAQYIYESIYLSLPYQRIHPEDSDGNSACNPEMLAKFKIISQDEFNELLADGDESGEEIKEKRLKSHGASLKD